MSDEQEEILQNIEEGEILEFWILQQRTEQFMKHDTFIIHFNDLLRTRVLEYYPEGKVYREYKEGDHE